jgi:hypothetical protein
MGTTLPGEVISEVLVQDPHPNTLTPAIMITVLMQQIMAVTQEATEAAMGVPEVTSLAMTVHSRAT